MSLIHDVAIYSNKYFIRVELWGLLANRYSSINLHSRKKIIVNEND
jgi:hypothetical protein